MKRGNLIALAALVAAPALAATTGTNPVGAEAIRKQMFDPVGGTTGAIFDAIDVGVKYLSALVAVFLSYYVIHGTVATAMEGAVLGKRWNKVWAPLRVCAAVSFLVPCYHGADLAQLTVVGVFDAGSRGADEIWAAFLGRAVLDQSRGQPPGLPMSLGGLALAKSLVKHEACVEAYKALDPNGSSSAENGWSPLGSTPTLPATEGVDMGGTVLWSWGANCGAEQISISDPNRVVRPSSVWSPSPASTKFVTDRRRNLGALVQCVRTSGLPRKVAGGMQPGTGIEFPSDVVSPLRECATQFEQSQMQASKTFFKTYDKEKYSKITEQSKAEGWTTSAEYGRVVAEIGKQEVTLASEAPDHVSEDLGDHFWNRETTRQVDHVEAMFDKVWSVNTKTERLTGSELASVADESSNPVTAVIRNQLNQFNEFAINLFGTTEAQDPLRSMIDYGHHLILTADAMVATLTLVAATSDQGVLGVGKRAVERIAGFDASKAVNFLGPIIWFTIGGLYAAGFASAYILPMLPWIAMWWLQLGLYLFFVEALVAAPILCLFLAHMDGETFITERTRPGFALLFNLLTRAPLGVLGLCLTFYLVPAALGWLSLHFASAFVGAQGGNTSFILGTGVALFTLSYLQYQTVLRCTQVIHELPNRVSNWVGFGANISRGEGNALTSTDGALTGGATASGATGRIEQGASKLEGRQGSGISKLPQQQQT